MAYCDKSWPALSKSKHLVHGMRCYKLTRPIQQYSALYSDMHSSCAEHNIYCYKLTLVIQWQMSWYPPMKVDPPYPYFLHVVNPTRSWPALLNATRRKHTFGIKFVQLVCDPAYPGQDQWMGGICRMLIDSQTEDVNFEGVPKFRSGYTKKEVSRNLHINKL